MTSTRYVVESDAEGRPTEVACGHIAAIVDLEPISGAGCEECLREGSRWVHLRRCLSCGHVGCCDSSPRRHATGHWQATSHPVIRSIEPAEEWAWCFADELFLAPASGPGG